MSASSEGPSSDTSTSVLFGAKRDLRERQGERIGEPKEIRQ